MSLGALCGGGPPWVTPCVRAAVLVLSERAVLGCPSSLPGAPPRLCSGRVALGEVAPALDRRLESAAGGLGVPATGWSHPGNRGLALCMRGGVPGASPRQKGDALSASQGPAPLRALVHRGAAYVWGRDGCASFRALGHSHPNIHTCAAPVKQKPIDPPQGISAATSRNHGACSSRPPGSFVRPGRWHRPGRAKNSRRHPPQGGRLELPSVSHGG